jgi:SAM-dependent methyltransferase
VDEYYFEKWNYADRRLGTGSMYWFARRYYADLVRRYAPTNSDGRERSLLELGCGLGDLLSLLQHEFTCTGIDPLDAAVDATRAAAPNATIVKADAEWLADVESESIDVVVALHVVEHLADPEEALRHVSRILRPGGLALIATPNPDYTLRRFKDRATDAIGKDPTHINVQSPEVWRSWCERAGLVIDRQFADALWDVPYIRVVPARLQFAVLGLPALAQTLMRGTWTPVSMGVNQILLMHVPRAFEGLAPHPMGASSSTP